jgi:hypothetical protein
LHSVINTCKIPCPSHRSGSQLPSQTKSCQLQSRICVNCSTFFSSRLRIPAVQAGSQPWSREEECEDIARAGGRHQALHCSAGPSDLQPQVISCRPIHRVVDPHHFNADPDPAFHFDANPYPSFHLKFSADPDHAFQFNANADQDPAFYFNEHPDLNPATYQIDVDLRPLVYRTSRAQFWVSMPLCCESAWPSTAPFWTSKAPF